MSETELDRKALKEAALKATPGPWTVIPPEPYDGEEPELEGSFVYPGGIEDAAGDAVCAFGWAGGSGHLFEAPGNPAFIALANPATILSLLASLEEAEGRKALYSSQPGETRSGLSVSGVCVEGSQTSIKAVRDWHWSHTALVPALRQRLAEAEASAEAAEQRDQVRKKVAADLHSKTAKLVEDFSLALGEKLAKAEEKYGYSDGWSRDDWEAECRAHLMEHIAKGDPRDVAAYCAFMWHHGWSTASRAALSEEEA